MLDYRIGLTSKWPASVLNYLSQIYIIHIRIILSNSLITNFVYHFRTACICLRCNVNSAPSAAPRQVQGRALNSTSLSVTWLPPPVDRENGPIVHYRVVYVSTGRDDGHADRAGDLTRDATSVVVPGSEESHVLSGLDKWTQYKVWVAASTSAGEGPLSDVIIVQTDEDGMSVSLRPSYASKRICTTAYFCVTIRRLT